MYKLTIIGLAILLCSACGSQDQTAKKQDPEVIGVQVHENNSASTLAILTARPADPINVTAARAMAAGKAVVVQGRIGGREKPFIEGRSAFLLADLKAIAACDANPDDDCATPWDYCCEETAKVATSTILVQVVDSNGKIVAASLQGAGGMKPGSFVVVSGTLSAQSTTSNPVLIADSVFVDVMPKK